MDATQALLEAGVSLQLGSGRRARQVQAGFARELSVEELVRASSQEAGIKPIPIKELRQSHHILARVLAQGTSLAEASIITGYAIARISILRGDPSFQELLSYYEDMEAEQHKVARADMHSRLASLGFDSIEVLHQKLLDDPDSIETKHLIAIVEMTSDRTGHGKTAKVEHAHEHSLSPETLERIKVSAGRQGGEIAEADRTALLSLVAERTADEHSSAEEAHWEPSGGGGLREEGGEGNPAEVLEQGSNPLPQVD